MTGRRFSGETTGIGSLPHTSVEAALVYSFAHDIPFLPQLPTGAPEELMLALATHPSIEPRERAWHPFLEALARTRPAVAKLQLAGPVTLARYLRFDDLKLLGAKARFQIHAVARLGITPMLFLDEPGLGEGLLEPLGALLDELKAAGAVTGVHCCGQASWARLLALPSLDIVSFDVPLSWAALMPVAEAFIERGGTLALGLDDAFEPPVALGSVLHTASCGLARASLAEANRKLSVIRGQRRRSSPSGSRDGVQKTTRG